MVVERPPGDTFAARNPEISTSETLFRFDHARNSLLIQIKCLIHKYDSTTTAANGTHHHRYNLFALVNGEAAVIPLPPRAPPQPAMPFPAAMPYPADVLGPPPPLFAGPIAPPMDPQLANPLLLQDMHAFPANPDGPPMPPEFAHVFALQNMAPFAPGLPPQVPPLPYLEYPGQYDDRQEDMWGWMDTPTPEADVPAPGADAPAPEADTLAPGADTSTPE